MLLHGFHDEGHGYDLFGMQRAAVERTLRWGRPAYEHYFRVRSYGSEHIPSSGAAILVANHGGVLPVDGGLLWLDVVRRTGRYLRPIADRFIPRLPFVSTMFARCGVVSGTRNNVRLLLERGELIAIFPEGVTGTAKTVRQRYRLQDWRVGHAELAIRHRAPIIPVAIVGAEDSWPLLARIDAFHVLGAPYLPIPASPLPLPVPVELHYGPPIALHDAHPPEVADDPDVVAVAAHRVRDAVAALLDQALLRRGCA